MWRASVPQAHGGKEEASTRLYTKATRSSETWKKTAFYHTIKNPKIRQVSSTDLSEAKHGVAADCVEAYGGMKMKLQPFLTL